MSKLQSTSNDTLSIGSSSTSSSFFKLFIALIKNKWALISVLWLFFIVFVAIFASEISPLDPNKNHIMERVSPPLTLDKNTEIVYHACNWDKNYLDESQAESLIAFLEKDLDKIEFCFMEGLL